MTHSEYILDNSGNINTIENSSEYNQLLVPFWSENPNVFFQSQYIM